MKITTNLRVVVLLVACCGILVGAVTCTLLYPPLEFQVSKVQIVGYGLHVSVRFTNPGFSDLTISGELELKIDGRDVYLRHMTFERFLLRPSQQVEFDVSPRVGNQGVYWTNLPFHIEATAFLTVNGIQRTISFSGTARA